MTLKIHTIFWLLIDSVQPDSGLQCSGGQVLVMLVPYSEGSSCKIVWGQTIKVKYPATMLFKKYIKYDDKFCK